MRTGIKGQPCLFCCNTKVCAITKFMITLKKEKYAHAQNDAYGHIHEE